MQVLDPYKKLIADVIWQYLQNKINSENEKNLSENKILQLVGFSKQANRGDYVFPCFVISKWVKMDPSILAKKLISLFANNKLFRKVDCIGAYVNFYMNIEDWATTIVHSFLRDKGYQFQKENPETVLVEYSSPNIAKPLSVAHLRSTSIGSALAAIIEFTGENVIRINYPGDWGTSFGKLVVAYEKWGSEYDFSIKPIDQCLAIYMRFHKELEKNPDLSNQAREVFRKLEEGDLHYIDIWNKIKAFSMKEFEHVYAMLNVHYDYYLFESIYQKKELSAVINLLNQMKLLEESEGAYVVNLDDMDMPPVLIQKTDGTTLYATRDFAGAIDRYHRFKFDRSIYVVGNDQSLYFRQLFAVLKKLKVPWENRCEHIGFGLFQITEGKLSTREGKVVLLEDVLMKAKDIARQKLTESNTVRNLDMSEEELDEISLQVGVSCVVFSNLKSSRCHNITFNWNELTNPKGETGAYLQYTHVRLVSLLNQFEKDIQPLDKLESLPMISGVECAEIVRLLSQFKTTVQETANKREPYILCRYLLNLAKEFSTYYQKNIIVNVQNIEQSTERILLIKAIQKIINQGIKLLGLIPVNKI